jgi:hypothetical protein
MGDGASCIVPSCTLGWEHEGDHLPFGVPTVLKREPALSGEVQQSTVDFPWIKEGLSVGPDEVLVVSIENHVSPMELRQVLDHLDRILGPTRYVFVTGMGARIAKVHKGQTGDEDAVLRASVPARRLPAS